MTEEVKRLSEGTRFSVESIEKRIKKGTDREIFGEELGIRTRTNGRPRVNREIAYQLIRADYSTQRICGILRCKARTVRLIKKEMEEKGIITKLHGGVVAKFDGSDLKFDDECVSAVGISFYEWLKSSIVAYKMVFGFNKKLWEIVFDRVSLVLLKEASHPLGDQYCMKFLEVFGEDKRRIRRRKNLARYLFRFLGRNDLCDRYLRVTSSRDPRQIREIPDLTLTDFPEKVDRAIDMVETECGFEYGVALRFKIVTQMRTGAKKKELMGIRVAKPVGSWLIMQNKDEFRGEIIGKRSEKWVLEWIPKVVRRQVYAIYKTREIGEKLFDIDINLLRRKLKTACQEVGITALNLHDLRKVSITWLWAMGVEMSIATEINVGWKDLNTARQFYLRNAEILRNDERKKYRDNIPEWFKDGLRDYILSSIPYSLEEIKTLLHARDNGRIL